MTPKERRKFLAQFKAARRFVAQAKRWMGASAEWAVLTREPT
jgi:hypothetical protein